MDLTTARNRLGVVVRLTPNDQAALAAARSDLAEAHILRAINEHAPQLVGAARTRLAKRLQEVSGA